MSQNPNPYESTSYGSNQPGGNQPNSNYSNEQYEPTQRAPGSGPNAYPPPYGQPSAGQGSNPSNPQYPPQQSPNPYQYSNPNPSTPPPPAYPPGQYAPPPQQYTPPPQQYMPPSQPSPRPRRTGRLFVLIGLAVLVILAGIIAAIAIPLHNTQVANDNATATAHTQGTAQAHNSTAVAQTNATATAQNVATATAIASTYPFSATAKLNDPLSDNSHGEGWKTGSNCAFTGGAYHATESSNNTYFTCAATSTNFSDFTYQVTMQIVKGAVAGVTFRGNDASSKYYSFIFGQDGSYILFLYTSGTNPKQLKSGTASQFNTGTGQSNDVGVVARGGTIDLYVNKQQLATVTDNTFTSGQIGVIVYDTGNAVDAAFSNLKVWQL